MPSVVRRVRGVTLIVALCTALIACGGGGGGGAAQAIAPTAQFIAPTQGAAITLGQSVTLAWTASATTGCVSSESNVAGGSFGGSGGTANQPAAGSATVTPTAEGSFTYTIQCSGDGGTAYANVTVTVAPPPIPKPTVTVTIPAQNASFPLGGQAAISWQSTGATACTGSASSIFAGYFATTNTFDSTVTTSGTTYVFPTGTGNHTYTVTCTGLGGSGSGIASVNVLAIPGAPSITISAPAPGASVVLGQSVTVTWQAPTANTCLVIDSDQDETGFGTNGGSVVVTPTQQGTVTYGVTCSDTAGRLSFAAAPPVTVLPNFLAVAKISAVGSTIDPMLHDQHPATLLLATQTAGLVTSGDLLTCNYSDAGGNVGQGTTVVGVHPSAGSAPYLLAQSNQLTGCNGLTALPDGTLFAAAYTAKQIPMITPAGVISSALPAGTFTQPSGIAYASSDTLYVAAVDLSRPDGGSIYRVKMNGDTPLANGIETIVSGLCTSGKPGQIFGPVALAYVPDTLYIADTSSGQVITITAVATFHQAGQVSATCGPPPTSLAKNEDAPQEDNINFFGVPSIPTPVGLAILSNGSLLIVNGDLPLPNSPKPSVANLAVEFQGSIGVLGDPRQLDAGPPGALSGVVAAQDDQGNPVVYFTDSNTNSIMVLKR